MADEKLGLFINDREIVEDDLTFREKREMRRVIREELMDDPNAEISDAYTDDFYLALIYIVLKRDKPDMAVEEALDLKLSDFLKPVPPTKAAAKRAK